VEIGTFKESDFDEAARNYRVVVDAEPGDYDMEKIAAMLHKVVIAATSWMDDRPCRHLHVPLPFSARTRRRRNGTLLLNRDRRECGRVGPLPGSPYLGDGATNFFICGT